MSDTTTQPLRPDATELDRRERLRWLVALRWWAMSGAVIAAVMATTLDWDFVRPEGIAAGVALGVIVNGVLFFRTRRSRPVGPSELSLHSVADTMALTWLLAFSGGLANPLSAIYSFHVVLAALLAGRVGAQVAGASTAFGVSVLFAIESLGALPSRPLEVVPPTLRFGALAILLLGLSYFALVLADRLREGRVAALTEQEKAERSLELLFDSLDALQVGIEVSRADEPSLRNRFGAFLVGEFGLKATTGDERMTFVDDTGDSRIVDRVSLATSSPAHGTATLWVDRTDALVVEQRHIMLERLATLGRALQGVAHELNTPLMTMQTLSRDLLAALEEAPLTDAQRADVTESTEILIDEARRCRSLTQSLLATAHERDRPGLLGQSAAVVASRAIRLVGDGGRRVQVDEESLAFPLAEEADRVLQILMNLIQNALQATPETAGEGPAVEVYGSASERAVWVRDHGEGLPESVRERLFEPFVTTRESGEGTGLGLYTSLRIAREIGGDLALSAAPERGTVAKLSLRAAPVTDSETLSETS